MNITKRIQFSVSNSLSAVVLRSDFDRFGSAAQVSRALNELTTKGRLVRLGRGVYAKAKPSVLSGNPIPVKPLEVLAPEALERLGVKVQPSRLAQDYNAGRSTQVPAGVVVNIGRQRVSRKLEFNGKAVQYELA